MRSGRDQWQLLPGPGFAAGISACGVNFLTYSSMLGVGSYGFVANALDYDILLSEFEFQLRCNVYFQIYTLEKSKTPPPLIIPPAMGLLIPQPFFYKDCFGI